MARNGKVSIELPLLGFIVATRAALGVGIGLLIADRLKDKRRAVGTALVTVGAITTVPAALALVQALKARRAIGAGDALAGGA